MDGGEIDAAEWFGEMIDKWRGCREAEEGDEREW